MEKNQQNQWKRDFFTIAGGQTVSLTGSITVQLPLIWWLASETASPIMMSIAGVFAFLPQLLLDPFADVWVDRLNRKITIIAADPFIGLVVLIFVFFFLFGNPPRQSVYLILGIRTVGNAFHNSTIQAMVSILVPQQELVRANGQSQFMQLGAFPLEPVLGTAMYASLPLRIILLSDLAGAFVVSTIVALVKIPDPKRQITQRLHFFHEMKEDVAAICQGRKLFVATVTMLLGMVFYAPLSTYCPLMTNDYFRVDAWRVSMVNLGYISGMMLCAILLGRSGTIRNEFPAIHLGLLGTGIPLLLCGLLPVGTFWFQVFIALYALLGVSSNLYNISYISYVQETTVPGWIGRTFSLTGSLTLATAPLGLLIARPIAKSRGASLWFSVLGIVLLLLALASAWLVLVQRVDQAEEGVGQSQNSQQMVH